jgi:hypothetical protein
MLKILSEAPATPLPSPAVTSPQFSQLTKGRISPEESKGSPRTVETLEVFENTRPNSPSVSELPSSRAFSFGGRDFKRTPLYDWLVTCKLEVLFETLVHNGYEDFDSLLDLMESSNPLNTEMLLSIGVKKPGHRDRLIAYLEEELREPDVETKPAVSSPFVCCTRTASRGGNELSMSLEVWMQRLGLDFLTETLQGAGYDDLEQILFLQKTRFALDDKRLCEIGIDKVGHRHRLLNKLQEEVYFGGNSRTRRSELTIERESKRISCESCSVM